MYTARTLLGKIVRKLGGPILFLFAVGLLVYSVRLSVVVGGSMEPTLHEGSRLVVDSLTYRLTGIHRGDVIVFTNPHDTKVLEVKRVVGLPNETVSSKGGTITITSPEGKVTEFPQGTLVGGSGGTGEHTIVLGPHDYYVLGDNRSHSTDSRDFGGVQPVNLVGRVLWAW